MRNRWIVSAVAVASMTAMTAMAAANFSDSDKDFLKDSAQGNIAEVQFGKLALQKSDNAKVKAFATKMIHDHTMLAKKMDPFVAAAGLDPKTALNSDNQDEYNKLNGLSGEEFNKEYIQFMDKDHHQDLKAFEKEFNDTSNMPLKTAVHAGKRVIQGHVYMVDSLDKQMGMTPAS